VKPLIAVINFTIAAGHGIVPVDRPNKSLDRFPEAGLQARSICLRKGHYATSLHRIAVSPK
jgi:hypothetical protein